MNEFTKEELALIRTGMRCVVTFVAVKDDYITANNLLEKIQSMIDNYEAKVIPVWHCEKCGHVQ